jgi:glucokinase
LAGFPRLLGDIGGTHVRWGLQRAPDTSPEAVRVQPCDRASSVAESALAYLRDTGAPAPRWAGIGVATSVTGDRVAMTNHPWSFSIRELQAALGVERCLVINDFTALAMSLPALGAGDRRPLGRSADADGVAAGTLALLGPGTGLGVSGLVPVAGGGWQPISGEGGHVTLAAGDDEEAEVLAWLRRRLGHVSAERVLSGAGLVNLHDAVRALAGRPAEPIEPAAVTARAHSGDADAARAVTLFTAWLGSVAGNLALTLGARAGVFVGGGIVPRLGPAFDEALFRQRFEAKGRFAGYLQPIPTWLITAPTPALTGASLALDLMPHRSARC